MMWPLPPIASSMSIWSGKALVDDKKKKWKIADAIEMARDAIGLVGIDMEDDGEELPEASALVEVQKEASEGAIVSLVDVDFTEYRRKNDLRTVKKNCTIPSWLSFEAERAGINFSAVLQAALKKELQIVGR